MPLFQEKIISKALDHTKNHVIPEIHLAILQSWKEKIESGSLLKQTEVVIFDPDGRLVQCISLTVKSTITISQA